MEKFKSNVHGRLKVNGKILNFGDKIELNLDDIKNNEMLRNLVTTKQLVRVFD